MEYTFNLELQQKKRKINKENKYLQIKKKKQHQRQVNEY